MKLIVKDCSKNLKYLKDKNVSLMSNGPALRIQNLSGFRLEIEYFNIQWGTNDEQTSIEINGLFYNENFNMYEKFYLHLE